MAGDLIGLKRDRDFSLMPWLLPASIRPDVRALGRFVRLAEGVAAAPLLSRLERAERLAALEALLVAPSNGSRTTTVSSGDEAVVAALRDSFVRHGSAPDGALRILRTLQHGSDAPGAGSCCVRSDDVVVHQTWADVLAYCNGVAAPIGRQMLSLSGEDLTRCGPPADALCAGMRILKELRDCEGQVTRGALLCIPASFMRDASITIHHLSAPSARGQTRAVLDRVLDGVDALLTDAKALVPRVKSRRLRIYVSAVLCRARKLAARCRHRDPLKEKVELSRWQRGSCVCLSVLRN